MSEAKLIFFMNTLFKLTFDVCSRDGSIPKMEIVEIAFAINNLQPEIDLIFHDRRGENSICDCGNSH